MNHLDTDGVLTKVMDLLERQLGTSCEIALHDLDRPYDSTIVDIRNGHITGRKIGDCGSNLGLEVIRGTVREGDKFNYITHTNDGKTLRSSSVFFYNDKGKACGCLCVNQDITDTIRFESFLRGFNQYEIAVEPVQEVFAQNVGELLDFFIAEGQKHIGKNMDAMNRSEKIEMVAYLDNKGAFQITKSSERVCELLGVSKFTLYHYLDIIRTGNENGVDKNESQKE